VVSSDASSLPEVVGDAGLTVAPTDVDALARALARLLDDDDLRRSLQQRAIARAAAFTWERVATQTIAAYERMGSGGEA
jgi:glycosyltransferase involved in cell wall biosynthesis